MSYFHRPDAGLEPVAPTEDSPRSPFSEVAGRFANWITGADRMPQDRPETVYDGDDGPIKELTMGAVSEEPSRFPVAPLGYSQASVDEHLCGLERELAELRAQQKPAVSITEELERIGEQTASILVVAHDQAHETTRHAQEQAERCMADAAAHAVAITSQAKQRLRELDSETDSVWRERERLLEDVRVVSAALAALADQASDRFPAADPSSASQATAAFSMDSEPPAVAAFRTASEPAAAPAFRTGSEPEAAPAFPTGSEPEAAGAFPTASAPRTPDSSPIASGPWTSEAFRMESTPWPAQGYPTAGASTDDESSGPDTRSGDTGSWLAGLEPPDQP